MFHIKVSYTSSSSSAYFSLSNTFIQLFKHTHSHPPADRARTAKLFFFYFFYFGSVFTLRSTTTIQWQEIVWGKEKPLSVKRIMQTYPVNHPPTPKLTPLNILHGKQSSQLILPFRKISFVIFRFSSSKNSFLFFFHPSPPNVLLVLCAIECE